MSNQKSGLYRLCMGLYVTYGLCGVMQFSPMAILVATVVLTLAIIAAHIGHTKAKGTLYESHFQWLVRTFWIGGGVYLPVMSVMAAIVIVSEFDTTAVKAAAEAGEESVAVLTELLLRENRSVISMVYFSLFFPFTIWWLYRCISGARRLIKGDEVPDPERWI
ncbi:MAG: hypothetical protein ACAH80_18100 [Alphaproteobacteria bacterium]